MIILNIFPKKSKFRAMSLFPFLIKKKGDKLSERVVNHEKIHLKQQIEMLLIFFYLWYVIEWLILSIKFKDTYIAYKNISFEKEAYINDNNIDYLKHRKIYSWFKYL